MTGCLWIVPPFSLAPRTRSRRGIATMYLITAMVVLMGFASLGVDLGRVQLAKSELQTAADAAVRAGAASLATSSTQAKADAIAVAAQNSVDGAALVLLNSEIQIGNWSGGVFTVNATPTNAIRVFASRTATKGNAIPMLFGSVIGRSSCDITATAIATATGGSPSGFIGLSSITMKNNTFVGSYSSITDTDPTQGSALSTSAMGSNGTISGGNNNTLQGTLMLGPSAHVSGITADQTWNMSTGIATPTSPTWSPASNPGGVSQNYSVGSTATLSGGTYWFTSLTVSGTLKFSGAATLVVSGDVDLSGTLQPVSLVPSDLKIYQIGTHTFGDSSSNGMDVTAVVSAPYSAFSAKNNLKFRGSGIFKTIDVKNNAEFFYDTVNGSATGAVSISFAQ